MGSGATCCASYGPPRLPTPSRSPRLQALVTWLSGVSSWNRPSARSTPRTARRSSYTSWTSCPRRSSLRSSAFPTPKQPTTASTAPWRCCGSASNGRASGWRTCEQSPALRPSHDGDLMSHPDPLDPLRRVLARHAAEGESQHRSPPGAQAVPVPRSPVGVVAQAETLWWTSVAGADRYRVTLFDGGGRVLFETQLADTLAVLPDSIVLDHGRPYLWKVDARTGWQRWAASGLVEFSIAGGPPR